MSHLRNLAASITIAVLLAGCGSQTSDSSSSVVPQTVSTGTNPNNGSISAPPTSTSRLGTPTLSRMGTERTTKSVSFVGCPSLALCILQGQSGIYTNYWYPLDGIAKPNLLITTQFSPMQGVTYIINPNPVHMTPATFTVTINVSPSASIGIQNVIISGTNSDGSTNPTYPYSFYICSATTGSCIAPAPSPTLTPAPPPPPIPGKGAYTADRTAHVIIPLTDPDTSSETLTWNVSGFPSTFTHVKFSSSTTSSPHTTSLGFDVGVDTIPQIYPLSIMVTSTTTGKVSSASTVMVTVPHVVGYYTIVNSSDLYETNAAQQVVVSDGSQYVSTGPIVVADFPGTSNGVATASIMRARQSISPILPSGVNLNGTFAVCIDVANLVGAQDGKTPATINIDVACANAEVISVKIATKSFGLDNNNFDKSLPDLATQTANCQNVVITKLSKNGGILYRCSTGVVALNHYTNQAAYVEISRTMNMYNDVLVKVVDVPLYWPLNAKGASYPKLAFDGGNGNGVPFPHITSPLVNCPSAIRGTATCPKSVAETFRENSIKYYATQGWMVPNGISIPRSGPLYQAHHVLPSGCGGGDAEGNGVFLTQIQHTPFTNWWLAVPPCASNNVKN